MSFYALFIVGISTISLVAIASLYGIIEQSSSISLSSSRLSEELLIETYVANIASNEQYGSEISALAGLNSIRVNCTSFVCIGSNIYNSVYYVEYLNR